MRFWTILLHAGYLTPYMSDKSNPYSYIVPNKEVKIDFYKSALITWMEKKINQDTTVIDRRKFVDDFEDCNKFKDLFQQLLDTQNDNSDKNEAYFKNYVGSMIIVPLAEMKFPKYDVLYEKINNYNKRADSVFLPMKRQSSTVIIHEYKILGSVTFSEVVEKSEDALWQIYSKKYMDYTLDEYKNIHCKHFKNIIIRGIVFYKSFNGRNWNIHIKEHQMTIIDAIKINDHFSSNGEILENYSSLSGGKCSRKKTLSDRLVLCEPYKCLDDLIEYGLKSRKRGRNIDDSSTDGNPLKKNINKSS